VVSNLDRHGAIGPILERRSLMVRCGNRRAAVCPSCSFTYSGDVWQVLAAGISGGRHDVPTAVGAHPLVFVTLTAPSFGPVHTTRESTTGRRLPCRPRRPGARGVCPHGRPTWCGRTHPDGDLELGTPLCEQCFDYVGLVAFNWHAPELWGRFTIALRRELAARLTVSEAELGRRVRVQYAKVAEFQRRGVVHFHAIIRLDGLACDRLDRQERTEDEDVEGGSIDAFPPPALSVGVDTLSAAVRTAAGRVRLLVDDPTCPEARLMLAFGVQADVRPIRDSVTTGGDLAEGDLSPAKVAAYVAKYATKAAEDIGLPPNIRNVGDVDRLGLAVSDHIRAILAVVDTLAQVHPRAARWAHLLGFRGHFATKSRHFSTTLTALRQARRSWRSRNPTAGLPNAVDTDELRTAGQQEGDVDGEETTLIIRWTLLGLGHRTPAEAKLAAAAADLARSRRQTRAANTRDHSRAAFR
jgi:replication initiator protein RepSA